MPDRCVVAVVVSESAGAGPVMGLAVVLPVMLMLMLLLAPPLPRICFASRPPATVNVVVDAPNGSPVCSTVVIVVAPVAGVEGTMASAVFLGIFTR